jgi:hypothetical protein
MDKVLHSLADGDISFFRNLQLVLRVVSRCMFDEKGIY